MGIRFEGEGTMITQDETTKEKGTMKELFKDSARRWNFLIFVLQWITGIFTYYNIYF